MNIQRIIYTELKNFRSDWKKVSGGELELDKNVRNTVLDIIAAVQNEQDAALLKLTNQFDQRNVAAISELCVGQERLQQALQAISAEQRAALETAAQRIREFHQRQRAESWYYTEADGTVLGQRVTPLDRVGLYVPGGKASYPSSVLMNAIPAKVAGVAKVVMGVPAPRGELNEMVLAAAVIAGVDKVFTIGGAQAIAALAYGTETVPSVDKIVGPGNI
ncbi:MAG TPA: histidinol dehydrogenase, partial [Pseudomonadales bacterium]|nr:histidinol dehydrogenase [Pseudomonadales bacterium]